MITLTPNAVKAARRFIRSAGRPVAGLRIAVTGGGCSGFQYALDLPEQSGADDVVLEQDGIKVLVDPSSAELLKGLTIDFVETLTESGFAFQNPNASHSCGCGKSFSA